MHSADNKLPDSIMIAASLSLVSGFQAPIAPAPVSSIVMKAEAVPVSVWADPIASHTSEVSMKSIAWDPLGLASSENLSAYREAEIKHGRVAMLAALGWPAAEELEPFFSKLLGVTDELVETGGRAPSLLNGGLEEAQIPYFLIGAFSIAGVLDFKGTELQKERKLEPGNVGFDPLSLFPADKETQEKYKLAELKHCRIAMVAISLYALEEAISGTSILQETVPLANEIERLALEGPIQGNIDLVKDLVADGKALTADIVKEEQFYGDAFTKPLFSRPDVKSVSGFGAEVLLPALAAIGAAAGANDSRQPKQPKINKRK